MPMVKWHGAAVEAKALAAAMDGLGVAAELISKKWVDTIPYASGDLASHVQPQKTGDLEYTISSTGPYARRQELDESLQHPDPTNPSSRSGRKAHAGRDALADNEKNIEKLINAKIAAALR